MRCEWFYSWIEKGFFLKNELNEIVDQLHLPHKLTTMEWSLLRSAFGKPRRFSQKFVEEERIRLYRYREILRRLLKHRSRGSFGRFDKLHNAAMKREMGKKAEGKRKGKMREFFPAIGGKSNGASSHCTEIEEKLEGFEMFALDEITQVKNDLLKYDINHLVVGQRVLGESYLLIFNYFTF
jgi:hypothetical protein